MYRPVNIDVSMRSTLITIFLFFTAFNVTAQLPVLNWVKSFEESNLFNPSSYSNGRAVGVDNLGNVYSAGYFTYSVDFDPGPGVYNMTGGSPFESGIYISKLDANGNFVWAGQIPTTLEFAQINLKVDNDGNVFLAADLRNTADMDPGPGVFMMTPTGFMDAFVAKINSSGNLVWAKQFGGPGDTGPFADMIEVDKDGNVLVCGQFNNTVDFDPGAGLFNLTSAAHQQAYIVKMDAAGNLLWAKQFGNGQTTYEASHIINMKCDAQGNIITTGFFAGTCDFDPGPGVLNVTMSTGASIDGFICKLDGNGNFMWVKAIGENGGDNDFITPTGLAIDGLNNIIITGFFIGSYDFNPGPGVSSFYANPWDCFIVKLDGQGDFGWAKVIGGVEHDTGHDIIVDGSNNVYVMGSFGTEVDFDPGPDIHILNSPYYGPSAIVKLTPGGDFMYAALFQSLNSGYTYFRRMVTDPGQGIYVTGYTYGENDFDPGPGVFPLGYYNFYTPFVLKLSRCLNITTSTLNVSTCSDYTLNNQTYQSSGTYTQTIPNSENCDSIITLNLVINKKFTAQSKTICEGDFFFAGGANQNTDGIYYDTLITVLGCDSIITTTLTVTARPLPDLGADRNICKNSELVISPGTFSFYLWNDNSTGSDLIVTTPGLYWVKVTNDAGCATSDTFKVAEILDLPAGFLKETDSVCRYGYLDLIANGSHDEYLWSTGSMEKSIRIQDPGKYELTVTGINGCSAKESITVYSKTCILGVYIPTAFTPNGDGRNDIFKPQVYADVDEYQLAVYNRWGNLVFQATDFSSGWDGRVEGVLQDNAIFVWVCKYRLKGQELKIEKGTVALIR
jgi:gliding motility-associated-like protein